MNLSQQQIKRLQLKEKLNYILEPLVIDTLIVMPQNPIKFMRQWLQKRQHIYRNAETIISYSNELMVRNKETQKEKK